MSGERTNTHTDAHTKGNGEKENQKVTDRAAEEEKLKPWWGQRKDQRCGLYNICLDLFGF